ncbi:MAG TPA: 2-phospho-L-lactate guanylyltransferase [Xanthobacteraceae bacterium]|nr:2-phospho-L-lactate guanylyltransferase [Xanthobacteraceae bacterium]
MMRPWVLIPIRGVQAGKSRLSTVLGREERAAFNELLLRRVMAAASAAFGCERTAVISACDQALHAARSAGVGGLRQCGGTGLNHAVAQGVAWLRSGGARPVLVLAADLPLIVASDLTEIADRGGEGRVVLCPDKHGTGTNAVLVGEGVSLRFAFGPQSCAAHHREAKCFGATPEIYVNERIAFDIDTPEDFRCWLASGEAPTLPFLDRLRQAQAGSASARGFPEHQA